MPVTFLFSYFVSRQQYFIVVLKMQEPPDTLLPIVPYKKKVAEKSILH